MDNLITIMQQKLQDLLNRIELLQKQFDDYVPVFKDDENLTSLVASLQQDMDNYKSKVTGLQSTLNTLSANYNSLSTNVNTNISNIENIQTNLNTLNEEYTSISTNVSNNTASIEELQTKTTEMQSSLTYTRRLADGLVSFYNELNEKIDFNAQNIQILQQTENTISEELLEAREKARDNYYHLMDVDTSIELLKSDILKLQQQSPSTDGSSTTPPNVTYGEVDNELYFILNGTYLTTEQITALVDGSYRL